MPADLSRPLTRVFLRRLAVQAAIGVYAEEHGRTQPLTVTVELDLDPTPFLEDDLAETVDYTTLAAHAHGLAATHIELVETFAERLAALCLEEPRARAVRVDVEKPEAVPGGHAGVEIVRVKGAARNPA